MTQHFMSVDEVCNKVVEDLEHEVKYVSGNKQLHFIAAKLLRAFNALFSMSWQEIDEAEQMLKDMNEDEIIGGEDSQ